ncbi:DUF2399 domain-containing protein (plasmid) [Deinococcus radiomollis]|uniref:DUF2399 domain-containing protein n=1 Tax=Deinococcus radiomollis TaxID=468916 RepID=UPI0038925A99
MSERMSPAHALAELSRLGLRPVLDAALRRYRRTGELGSSRPNLSPEAWLALSRLTGLPPRGRVDLAELDDALRHSRYALGLTAVLEALNGAPIVVKRQAKATLEARWSALLKDVPDSDWQLALGRDEAGATLLRATLKDAEPLPLLRLVSQALGLARCETLSFPVLAARLTGNAHALDTDTPAGKVLRAALHGLNLPAPLRDGVSSTVLIANVRGPDWLNAAAGHCLALPWRETRKTAALNVEGNMLRLVENPSVFEALHTAYPHLPLLCSSGQPGAATVALLTRLPASTTVYLSCDLDLGGLRIAAHLMRTVPLDWRPWRMDAAAHRLASGRGTAPLNGDPSSYATEFPSLVAALQESGQGAHQENLLPELLADAETDSD